MPILNYTTKIKPEKTAEEIQTILRKAGARAVMTEYADNEVVAVAFQYEEGGNVLSFRLPINDEGVLRALKRNKVQNSYCNLEQARRTAWRIVKDWVEAQMAFVESEQVDLVEVFLPHLQDDTGTTVYKRLKSGGFKALTYQPEKK